MSPIALPQRSFVKRLTVPAVTVGSHLPGHLRMLEKKAQALHGSLQLHRNEQERAADLLPGMVRLSPLQQTERDEERVDPLLFVDGPRSPAQPFEFAVEILELLRDSDRRSDVQIARSHATLGLGRSLELARRMRVAVDALRDLPSACIPHPELGLLLGSGANLAEPHREPPGRTSSRGCSSSRGYLFTASWKYCPYPHPSSSFKNGMSG